MKLIKFTFLSVVVSSIMVVELQAQGPRRDGERPQHERPQQHRPDHRKEQHRIQNSPQRIEQRGDRNRNQAPVYVKNERREPIHISNHKNHSYGKPVKNFDQRGYTTYHHNQVKFYGNNGLFYRFHNNAYVRFAPPVGFSINLLPVGHVSINIGSRPYYFYEGVYYEKHNRHYRVAQPPMGTLVYELPYGYEKINYYGKSLYEFAGVLYDKVYQRDGMAYEIVGFIS